MGNVSIIVPVYNVEQYLEEALYSLQNQTYKDIEIILVNDGSTDASGQICEAYALKDSRIKVFHTSNKGQSAARNFGVQQALSDWIIFMDADDYYELYAVEYLIAIKNKYQVQMVSTMIEATNLRQDYRENVLLDIDNIKFFNKEEALTNMFYGEYFGTSPCGKLYNKSVLLKHPYVENMIYEDVDMAYEHIFHSDKLCAAPLTIYKYYRREGSTVNSKYNNKMLDFFTAMKHNFEYIERDFPNNEAITTAAISRYVLNGLHIANAMLKSKMYKEVNQLKIKFRPYLSLILRNKRLHRKNKIKFLLFMIHPRIYEKIRLRYIDK